MKKRTAPAHKRIIPTRKMILMIMIGQFMNIRYIQPFFPQAALPFFILLRSISITRPSFSARFFFFYSTPILTPAFSLCIENVTRLRFYLYLKYDISLAKICPSVGYLQVFPLKTRLCPLRCKLKTILAYLFFSSLFCKLSTETKCA